jgi:hypothetical protein
VKGFTMDAPQAYDMVRHTGSTAFALEIQVLKAKLEEQERINAEMAATMKEQAPKLAKLEAKLNVYRRIAQAFVSGHGFELGIDQLKLLEEDGIDLKVPAKERSIKPADVFVKEMAIGMTAQDAARRGVCRVCGQREKPPMILDFGREFAHEACLRGTEVAI